MKRIIFALLALLLLTLPQWSAPAAAQQENCLFFTETVEGQGGFSVCDDTNARFRTAFETWGLLKIGYARNQPNSSEWLTEKIANEPNEDVKMHNYSVPGRVRIL